MFAQYYSIRVNVVKKLILVTRLFYFMAHCTVVSGYHTKYFIIRNQELDAKYVNLTVNVT